METRGIQIRKPAIVRLVQRSRPLRIRVSLAQFSRRAYVLLSRFKEYNKIANTRPRFQCCSTAPAVAVAAAASNQQSFVLAPCQQKPDRRSAAPSPLCSADSVSRSFEISRKGISTRISHPRDFLSRRCSRYYVVLLQILSKKLPRLSFKLH